MGIVRYPVQCPGCDAKVLLRVAVGMDERQPFFYVCGACLAATRGTLVWHGTRETSLEVEAGTVLKSEDGYSQTISINPDYPSVADAKDLSEPGGSTFILAAQLLGP